MPTSCQPWRRLSPAIAGSGGVGQPRRLRGRGIRASHSRFFWGLRLHLVCTLRGLPVIFTLTGAKADERETLLDLLAVDPQLIGERPGQTLIGDKNHFGREFEQQLAELDIRLLRPARKGEAERAGSQLFRPLRQVIESINETFKGQLDLERHRGRTPAGVAVRVLQRSSRSPPPSGTTTTSASRSCGH